jgi:hypothetical protein
MRVFAPHSIAIAPYCYDPPILSRRDALTLSGFAAASAAMPAWAQDLPAPDYRLEIAPVTLDLILRQAKAQNKRTRTARDSK